ncbi:MAG: hypothetical protein A2075_00660 [Geobacteraceae bacterium GWC2_58_44]|nr:MAG: hypothetical protein A2075_00660 [Geobacteraceae bacterium GWC2_58_44]
MLDRIVVDVIQMTGVIGFVAQEVLPIAVLPQGLFTSGCTGGARDGTQGRRTMFGEPGFYQPPTGGKIGVTGRQGQDAVQMVGHDHHRVDLK